MRRGGIRRTGLRGCAGVIALVALCGPAAVASANPPATLPAVAQGHAYRHGVVPTRGHQVSTASTSTSANNLLYGGGVSGVGVTTGKPRVYLVFWGSQWGTQGTNSQGNVTLSGDPSGMAPYVEAFIKGIGTSQEKWSGVMTQYCQGVAVGAQSCPSTAAHVGYPNGGAFAGVWVDESAAAPSQATGNQIGAEAVNAATHFGNTTQSSNRNTQYVIISPHNTHPDGFDTSGSNFCAWHDYTGDSTLTGGAVSSPDGLLAFTNLPYITDAGQSCGADFVNPTTGALDGVSIVEGHEYAETITDQYPAGGWLDNSGYEDGDKCAWISSGTGASQNITLSTGTFAVQSTWANDYNGGSGGCEVSHPIVSVVSVTNPGSQTTTSGQSVSLQIKASDSNGFSLTYSATGLPAGLSINSSTGLITGSPTTAGTYSVKVSASDSAGSTGSTSFTWTVSAAGTGTCTAAQLLGNPGFETGSAAPWTSTAGAIQHATTSEPAHSGNYIGWLNGPGSPSGTKWLAQTVTLPSGCTHYTFSFWRHIDTTESTASSYDKLLIQVVNSSGTVVGKLATYSNLDAASGYTQLSFDLSSYAGQTITVRFVASVTNGGGGTTNFVIDDAAVNVS